MGLDQQATATGKIDSHAVNSDGKVATTAAGTASGSDEVNNKEEKLTQPSSETSTSNGVSFNPFICCPMCKTDVNLPKSGLNGFKDNLLIVEMIRRWYEKRDFNDATPKTERVETRTQEVDGQDIQCTCLPAWRNVANGRIIDSISPAKHTAQEETTETSKFNYDRSNVDAFITRDSASDGDSIISSAKCIDSNVSQYYCLICDVITCLACRDTVHLDHHTMSVAKATEDKKAYLDRLLVSLQDKMSVCDTTLLQVENTHQHLLSSTEHVVKEIEDRAEKQIRLVEKRRDQLISELSLILKLNEQKHSICKERLHELQEKLKTASKFSHDLLEYGSYSEIMYLNNDVSDRLHELLREQNNNGADIMNVQLEVPDYGRDESHLEKSFGSLVKGEVKCGSAELLRSFDIDLKWPTGMATTKNKEFVVTGKMGAFEEKGKVMFFGRSGQLKNVYDLPENCIPYDTTVTSDGTVLVSDNNGKIHKFDSSGCKMEIMDGKFKGVGRLAPVENMWGHFVVTSSDERRVHVYKPNGERYLSLPKCSDPDSHDIELLHPHYVATNHDNDIIVSDFEQNAMFVFNSKGDLRFQYGGNGIDGGDLRCPSAVCCDHFNNILVADFMNDRVHLVSQSGHFLGYLLTKDNDVSCPNFLSIDGDGHLFVGQYGGQIQVFRYLSYVKFV